MRATTIAVFVAAALLAAVAHAEFATFELRHVDEANSHRTVQLKTGKVNTLTAAPAFPLRTPAAMVRAVRGNAHHEATGYAQYLVHHTGPVTEHQRTTMAAHLSTGSLLYVPHNTWLVVASADEIAAISHEPFVLWVGAYKDEYKLHPRVVDAVLAQATPCADAVHLRAHVDAGAYTHGRTVEDVRAELAALLPAGSLVERATATDVYVAAPCGAGADAGRAVASHPLVQWVEHKEVFQVKNEWAANLVQSFIATGAGSAPFTALSPALDGTNQVVGCADTGLDMSNCFFSDASVQTPFNTVNDAHRKVVQYQTGRTSDNDFFTDYSGGHGTHVAGTIAGNVNPSASAQDITDASPYRGVAFNAKLAFYDFGNAEGGLINVDVKDDMFPAAKTAGANIHSNSWGSNGNPGGYSLTALDVDQYTWDNKDFLPLFAASNDGREGFISVRPPGTAKNTVSVGASKNDYRAEETKVTQSRLDVTVGGSTYTGYRTTFGGRATGATLNAELITYSSSSSCSTSFSAASGKIVALHQSDSCSSAARAEAAQTAGAVGIIFYYEFTSLSGSSDSVTIPSLSVARSLSSTFSSADGTTITIADRAAPDYSSDTEFGKDNVACFSSRGPTLDGRIKPDITAPGDPVISAYANGPSTADVCGKGALMSLSGTSMATPAASGAAALVRQYYMDGYHPTGSPVILDKITNPSAALIKATLIASAVSHTGNVQNNADCSTSKQFSAMTVPEKRMYEGFGHLQLDQVLHTASPAAGDKKTLVYDVSAGLATGASTSTCFSLAGNQPFRATLVWTDAPGSAASAIHLVNDLDLIVTKSDGSVVLGNQLTDGTSTTPIVDATNNVEQVTITTGHSGTVTYTVTVSAYNVPTGPQPYALVVTADSLAESTGCTGGCPNSCSNQGTCNNGRCACTGNFAGADCSIAVTPITIGSSSQQSVSVGPNEWKFFSFTPDLSENLDVKFSVSVSSGVPVFMGLAGEYPTPSSATDVLNWCADCEETTQSGSARSLTFWVREDNLAASGSHFVAVYGYPYEHYTYTGSTTSATFTTEYARFTTSASSPLVPSALLSLLVAVAATLAMLL